MLAGGKRIYIWCASTELTELWGILDKCGCYELFSKICCERNTYPECAQSLHLWSRIHR